LEAPVGSNFFAAMRAFLSVCFISAAICFSRAESSLRQWSELGRLEGGVVAWKGEGWSDGRTIRLAGISFPSSKSILRVIDNPPGNRQSLSSALAAIGAVAGSNGGYFHKDFTPLGLAVSRGETIHRFERARLLSGVLAVRHGRMELVRAGRFKSGSDVQEALQAGPWLVEKGAPVAGLDDTRSARRTIIANDGKGQWALIATSSITLADASRLLCAKGIIGPLKIVNALNLDGGSSTALQAGLPPEILIDIAALGPVRNYLAIAPRKP
jgi:Phosphodiester glycosidase